MGEPGGHGGNFRFALQTTEPRWPQGALRPVAVKDFWRIGDGLKFGRRVTAMPVDARRSGT